MSAFDDKIQLYLKAASDLKMKVDVALLTQVAKGLGPSIYKDDSALVSISDKDERDRVKNNFLIKKLGMKDGPKLDAAIQDVAKLFGSSNRHKYRALFYYLLVKNLGKESHYA